MSDTLVRYGLHWQGPQEFVCEPMSDGLWTPWQEAHHALTAARELANKAQAELAEARRERDMARAERDTLLMDVGEFVKWFARHYPEPSQHPDHPWCVINARL